MSDGLTLREDSSELRVYNDTFYKTNGLVIEIEDDDEYRVLSVTLNPEQEQKLLDYLKEREHYRLSR